jgi:hypothetical protein
MLEVGRIHRTLCRTKVFPLALHSGRAKRWTKLEDGAMPPQGSLPAPLNHLIWYEDAAPCVIDDAHVPGETC